MTPHWPDATRHFVGLVVGWLGFSVFLGLFNEFDRMEASNAVIPSLATGTLLTEIGLTFLVGIIILATPIFIWWWGQNTKQKNRNPLRESGF